MNRTVNFTIAMAALLAVGQSFAQTDRTAEVQFKAAQHKQEVEGDIKGAIKDYKKLADGKDHAIAAKALVALGQSYEKLGQGEASSAYERVVREFSDQSESAEIARTRLSALASPQPPRPSIYLADIDTRTRTVIRDPKRLASGVDVLQDRDPSFSPDGKSIAYDAEHRGAKTDRLPPTPASGNSSVSAYSIVVRSTETEAIKDYAVGDTDPGRPIWLNSGAGLLYITGNIRRTITRLGLKGEHTDPTMIVSDVKIGTDAADLSKDDRLLYALVRGVPQSSVTAFDIVSGKPGTTFLLPALSNQAAAVNTLYVNGVPVVQGSVTSGGAHGPQLISLSPDGRTIAMIRNQGRMQLLTRFGALDGSDYRILTDGNLWGIRWSKDGRELYFAKSVGVNDKWQIMRIPAEGGVPLSMGLEVTGFRQTWQDFSFDVSPDDKRIVFDGLGVKLLPTSK